MERKQVTTALSTYLLVLLLQGSGAVSPASAQQLYLSDTFDNHSFSPQWSEGRFDDSLYAPHGQQHFVDFEGRGGVVNYFTPAGYDEITPAQMGVAGNAEFERLFGRSNLDEFYLEWSEYYPAEHDFADIGQKLVRFNYWMEGEEKGAEITFAVLNNNSRMQMFLFHPRGSMDGSPLDLGIDGPPIPVGRWVRLGLWARLNTPGQADGFARAYVDGQPWMSGENLSWRGSDSRGWNLMWLGGNHSNASQPTTNASNRYIDDVKFYSTMPGNGYVPPPDNNQPPSQPNDPQIPSGPPITDSPNLPEPWPRQPSNKIKDFTGDSRSDYAVWRPSTGTWFILNSDSIEPQMVQWGLPGDKPLRGDYDGDGVLDLVVWRPSDGTWYMCYSGKGYDCSQPGIFQFGLPGDYPVNGDIDGDGKADMVVYRPFLQVPGAAIIGQWYFTRSSDGSVDSVQWGLPQDIPSLADFDGDGADDLTVWRPESGHWYRKSLTGSMSETPLQWGLPGDKPMAADYDGDGKADAAVWRPANGTWYICASSQGDHISSCQNGTAIQFGLPGDIPVIGTFDGSGAAGPAVWRPRLGPIIGTWFVMGGSRTDVTMQQWGLDGDVPIGLGTADLGR